MEGIAVYDNLITNEENEKYRSMLLYNCQFQYGEKDDVHTENNTFKVSVQNINKDTEYEPNDSISVFVSSTGKYPLSKASLYLNGTLFNTLDKQPFVFRFSSQDIPNVSKINNIRVIGTDSVFNTNEDSMDLKINFEG